MGEMLSMDEAKKAAKADAAKAAGIQFVSPTGATGTVTGRLSERGKPTAELTCTEANCTETHEREISDWHQCGKCRTHKKSKSKGGGGGGSVTAGGLREVKILDTDTPEVRRLKEENNRIVAEIREKETEIRKADQAKAAEERKAKAEKEKAEREAKRAEQVKQELAARLAKVRQVAEEKGLSVSPKTEAEVAEFQAEQETGS